MSPGLRLYNPTGARMKQSHEQSFLCLNTSPCVLTSSVEAKHKQAKKKQVLETENLLPFLLKSLLPIHYHNLADG